MLRRTSGATRSFKRAANISLLIPPNRLSDVKQIDPERRKELRTQALEHLEAARACLDETGDGVATYLVERTIDEVTTQLYAGLDPFSENWPAKKAR